MDSLAGGVSHLSISESPALARIPQVRDLDDKGHQALDKSILEALGLYIELNREPNWAFLLSNIQLGSAIVITACAAQSAISVLESRVSSLESFVKQS
jgi:hypothetical protein